MAATAEQLIAVRLHAPLVDCCCMAREAPGGDSMESQLKQDIIACGAIAAMFVGASVLPYSWFGLALLTVGLIVMLFLFLAIVRRRQ